ncbi:MAG: Rnf-Nqr domain containing protein [Thermodesulfobacteriota bacterium]
MARKTAARQIMLEGLWQENPILRHTLGICSTLAVTNLLVNTLVMNIGLIFTLTMSCTTVSLLRNLTPLRIRMMVQTLIISSYVIIFDIVIKAYLPDISEALGPYVGLIITNCIIMGRCEAFARSNRAWPSFLDGLAVGIGFSLVLFGVAFVRELLGFGSLFGYLVMPETFTPWTIMIMPPGAFFTLGIYVWLVRSFAGSAEPERLKM